MFLIVLDLNGVLVKHRGKGKGAVRPGAVHFVTHLLARPDTKVAIWTSITAPNAKLLIDAFLPQKVQEQLLFVWTSDQCSPSVEPYKKTKDMSRVWSRYTQFNMNNTVILDDDVKKVPLQPDNICVVPEYQGPLKAPTDRVLYDFMSLSNTDLTTILNVKDNS